MIEWHDIQIIATVGAMWMAALMSLVLAILSLYRGVWISFPRIIACVFFAVAAPSLAVKYYNNYNAHLESLFLSVGVVIVMAEEVVQAYLSRQRQRRSERKNHHA